MAGGLPDHPLKSECRAHEIASTGPDADCRRYDVVYREFAIEAVPIVQIVTLGAAAVLIGAIWLYWRARRP